MEPREFEQWTLDHFSAHGYEVKPTPLSGDAGADGIAIAPTGSGLSSYVIQCKHTQGRGHVNEQAVEEVLRALGRYPDLPRDVQPVVVTNAEGFTVRARILAQTRGVRLVARDGLNSL